jgi:hypothetical protein
VARRTLLFLPRLGPLATVGSVIEPRLSMPFQLPPTLADAKELSLLNRHRSCDFIVARAEWRFEGERSSVYKPDVRQPAGTDVQHNLPAQPP